MRKRHKSFAFNATRWPFASPALVCQSSVRLCESLLGLFSSADSRAAQRFSINLYRCSSCSRRGTGPCFQNSILFFYFFSGSSSTPPKHHTQAQTHATAKCERGTELNGYTNSWFWYQMMASVGKFLFYPEGEEKKCFCFYFITKWLRSRTSPPGFF